MNTPAHWFALPSMLMHLMMGITGLFGYGPPPPSWALLYSLFPWTEWAYPLAYLATGVVAAVGIRQSGALRLSYAMSGLLFLAWAMLGLLSMARGTGGNLIGSSANFYVFGLCLVITYYVRKGTQSDRISAQVGKLQEQIDEVRNGE